MATELAGWLRVQAALPTEAHLKDASCPLTAHPAGRSWRASWETAKDRIAHEPFVVSARYLIFSSHFISIHGRHFQQPPPPRECWSGGGLPGAGPQNEVPWPPRGHHPLELCVGRPDSPHFVEARPSGVAVAPVDGYLLMVRSVGGGVGCDRPPGYDLLGCGAAGLCGCKGSAGIASCLTGLGGCEGRQA